jgi:hypothetical protein
MTLRSLKRLTNNRFFVTIKEKQKGWSKMNEKKELIELSAEDLEVELKTLVFIDDVKIFCEKYKVPENIIEEKFLTNENLPKRIVRTIFTNKPLSKEFLAKYREHYDIDLLASNPHIDKETIEQLRVIEKLTEKC